MQAQITTEDEAPINPLTCVCSDDVLLDTKPVILIHTYADHMQLKWRFSYYLSRFRGVGIVLNFCPMFYDLFAVFQFPTFFSTAPFHSLSSMYRPRGAFPQLFAFPPPNVAQYRFTPLCVCRYWSAFACYMNGVKREMITLTATREAFLAEYCVISHKSCVTEV
jgi:hypothetical protein